MSDSLRHHGLQHARLPCPSSIISRRLLKLMSLESVMPSNRLILCHPLLLLPPSFPASGSFPMSWLFISAGQGIGASTSAFNHSNEYSGLTSFRIDRFDLLAVQGTLESSSAPQNSKASLLQCSTIFMVQHSHLNVSPEKTIALTIWTFVGKMMSLLFNMLSWFAITVLPRSKCLLISWLRSLSTAILEPK